ncbi:hypothetical protein WJX77_001674 [Trebouxia sp. C0004]
MPRLHKLEAGAEAGMPASASWRLRDTGEIRCTSQDPGVPRNVQQMRTPRETPARRNVLGLRRGSLCSSWANYAAWLLLDGLHGEILVQHAAWLADEKLRLVQVHDALFFYMHGISDGT